MKLSEQNLLEYRCALEELISERESMIAENKFREYLNQSQAYLAGSFNEIQMKIQRLRESLILLGEK